MNLKIIEIAHSSYRDSNIVNLPNTSSETSIQTIAKTQLSCEPTGMKGSKKRKYDSKGIDSNDLQDRSVKTLLRHAQHNLSNCEENQKNGSSSDKEQMEIDQYGEESENGEKKTCVVLEKIEEESRMEVGELHKNSQ
jgi:hypothetical protein